MIGSPGDLYPRGVEWLEKDREALACGGSVTKAGLGKRMGKPVLVAVVKKHQTNGGNPLRKGVGKFYKLISGDPVG